MAFYAGSPPPAKPPSLAPTTVDTVSESTSLSKKKDKGFMKRALKELTGGGGNNVKVKGQTVVRPYGRGGVGASKKNGGKGGSNSASPPASLNHPNNSSSSTNQLSAPQQPLTRTSSTDGPHAGQYDFDDNDSLASSIPAPRRTEKWIQSQAPMSGVPPPPSVSSSPPPITRPIPMQYYPPAQSPAPTSYSRPPEDLLQYYGQYYANGAPQPGVPRPYPEQDISNMINPVLEEEFGRLSLSPTGSAMRRGPPTAPSVSGVSLSGSSMRSPPAASYFMHLQSRQQQAPYDPSFSSPPRSQSVLDYAAMHPQPSHHPVISQTQELQAQIESLREAERKARERLETLKRDDPAKKSSIDPSTAGNNVASSSSNYEGLAREEGRSTSSGQRPGTTDTMGSAATHQSAMRGMTREREERAREEKEKLRLRDLEREKREREEAAIAAAIASGYVPSGSSDPYALAYSQHIAQYQAYMGQQQQQQQRPQQQPQHQTQHQSQPQLALSQAQAALYNPTHSSLHQAQNGHPSLSAPQHPPPSQSPPAVDANAQNQLILQLSAMLVQQQQQLAAIGRGNGAPAGGGLDLAALLALATQAQQQPQAQPNTAPQGASQFDARGNDGTHPTSSSSTLSPSRTNGSGVLRNGTPIAAGAPPPSIPIPPVPNEYSQPYGGGAGIRRKVSSGTPITNTYNRDAGNPPLSIMRGVPQAISVDSSGRPASGGSQASVHHPGTSPTSSLSDSAPPTSHSNTSSLAGVIPQLPPPGSSGPSFAASFAAELSNGGASSNSRPRAGVPVAVSISGGSNGTSPLSAMGLPSSAGSGSAMGVVPGMNHHRGVAGGVNNGVDDAAGNMNMSSTPPPPPYVGRGTVVGI